MKTFFALARMFDVTQRLLVTLAQMLDGTAVMGWVVWGGGSVATWLMLRNAWTGADFVLNTKIR